MPCKSLLTRAAFLAGMVGLAELAWTSEARAERNLEAEQYTQERLSEALRWFVDDSMSAAQRRRAYERVVQQSVDFQRICTFVLGRHSTQLRTDEALRLEWTRTYRDYAVALFEDRLRRFTGDVIRVTGSVERVPGRDVIVTSELLSPGGARPIIVQIRILRSGEVWRAVDLSTVFEDGRQIWMAQQQRNDIVAQLDRTNGDIRGLMTGLRERTRVMHERIAARS